MAVPVNTLMDEGKCYLCFGSASYAEVLKLALLRRWLLSLFPLADVTPQGLLTYSTCYACLGLSYYQLMALAMLDQIDVSGGGTAVVQTSTGTGSNSAALTFGSVPETGNLIVVAISSDATMMAGDVTDNRGNSYTLRTSVANAGSGVAIFTATVSSSGTPFTVTSARGGASMSVAIYEARGVNSIGSAQNNTGNSTTPSVGPFTVSGIIIGIVSGGTNTTITPGSWQQVQVFELESSAFPKINTGYSVSSGAVTPNWTLGTSQNWSAAAIALDG